VRDLAVACAKAYVESRERLGHPLLARRGGTAGAGEPAETAAAGALAGGGAG
jgi:hypothetical protein